MEVENIVFSTFNLEWTYDCRSRFSVVPMDNGIVSNCFSSKQIETCSPRRQIVFHIIRRSFILILLGLIIDRKIIHLHLKT
ncbi:hypothetical protein NQ317_010333 [Molorchus minor]|uniref:Uncharacterized protein n=1 Tax=Molorchus minor TaxID=1323400 RepID=A0ABQ9J3B0_9CUCU|nr:hypothetical protein NQ317_010333 [Molorchus minor]